LITSKEDVIDTTQEVASDPVHPPMHSELQKQLGHFPRHPWHSLSRETLCT